MELRSARGVGVRRVLLPLGLCLALASSLSAHAILLESKPAARSTVDGPDVEVRLRFNARIDSARSRLTLLLPDQSLRALTIGKQDRPELLSAQATGLASGSHRLRWQVLAEDGHITRGEVPFQVR